MALDPPGTLAFGIRLPVAGPLAGPAAVARAAVAAEELEFDAAWVHDYIIWTRELDRTHVSCGMIELVKDDVEPRFLESLTTLAFVAGQTHRIRLGTAVLCLPYRQPVVAARQLATLDVLSGGRLILGVGVGANKSTHNQDFEVLGVPRAEKYDRAREYLSAMKVLWTEDTPSYDGRFVSFPQTEMYPKPVQGPHPPIWFGGRGPKAIELVAEHGDGWLPTWLTPEGYREHLARVGEALAVAGRPGARITIGDEIIACIAPTHEAAVEKSRATVATLTSGFTVESLEAANASALIGSPGEVLEKASRLVEAGVDHFELKFIYGTLDDLLDQLELFRDSVARPLRRAVRASPATDGSDPDQPARTPLPRPR
jgi:probable F420-dependent oxidoreductase